ncbi:MAG: hypothetical protein RLZ81_3287 [Pseudomonadota bacterium]|jgi:hypothetical protein
MANDRNPNPTEPTLDVNVIARPGALLRELITRSGWRKALDKNHKLAKLIDDAANESSPSRLCENLQCVEAEFLKVLEAECGTDWSRRFAGAWQATRACLQDLVQQVDASVLDDAAGRELVLQRFAVPQIAGFVHMMADQLPGPPLERWWAQPFEAWLAWTADQIGTDSQSLADAIHPDRRTTDRWRTGETAAGYLRAPYTTLVGPLTKPKQKQKQDRPRPRPDVSHLCGWLTVSVAFQSLPLELRARIQAHVLDHRDPGAGYRQAVRALCDEVARRVGEARLPVFDLVAQIEDRFELRDAEDGLADPQGIEAAVVRLGQCIEALEPRWQASLCFLRDRMAARLATLQKRPDQAARLYARAVQGSWWRAGPNQRGVLTEALLQAVGCGDRSAALAYWGRLGLLGMHEPTATRLDEMEWRRLAIAYETAFAPLRAAFSAKEHPTNRVPADTEYLVGSWEPSARERKEPNRKMARDDGRTRRTPLMEAVMLGTLDDVKAMVAAGGDVNQSIPESGEGPLMYALRRAHMQKEPEILHYLLDLGPSVETVNRVASTLRETPLSIAIQMGSAEVVERLIGLGARVGDPCDAFSSALSYARAQMVESQQFRASPQAFEAAWRQGGGRPNGDDARAGALFAADLPARRQAQFERQVAMAGSQEWRDKIAVAVMARMVPAPEDLQAVIEVLQR